METTKEPSRNQETSGQLKAIIVKILEIIDVERIYLIKGSAHHSFKFRLNIIAKLSQKDNLEDIRAAINCAFMDNEDFIYTVFSFGHTQRELQQSNLYFLNNCHQKNLVYQMTQENPLWNYPPERPDVLIEKIKQSFKRDMSRMKSFRKGVLFFRTEKNFAQSAFMLHQSFEQGYRILESFMCGNIKICHSIKSHQIYVLKTLIQLKGMFQVDSDAECNLLDLLEDAYSLSRYSHNYRISEKEIDQLFHKLGLFIKEIKYLLNEEISVFNDITIQDEIDSCAEQSTKASTNNYESDDLVRKFEFENSFEMLCMAKSLMLLSVTCLHDDVYPQIEAYGFHYDIMQVLQMAIELLPLKETSP